MDSQVEGKRALRNRSLKVRRKIKEREKRESGKLTKRGGERHHRDVLGLLVEHDQ